MFGGGADGIVGNITFAGLHQLQTPDQVAFFTSCLGQIGKILTHNSDPLFDIFTIRQSRFLIYTAFFRDTPYLLKRNKDA